MNKSFCDVLIFGAGIVGASLALHLAQSGMKIIIVDNKRPAVIKKKQNRTLEQLLSITLQ